MFEDLEPRVLLSADPLAVAISDGLDVALTGQTLEESAPLVALMEVPEAPRLDAGLDPTAGVAAPEPLDLDGVAGLMDEGSSDQIRVELLFVDPRVEDYQQLIDGLAEDSGRSFEVIVLDADRDGIEQIGEALSTREGVDAVHIISHGSQTGIQIASTWLTADNLSSYESAITAWASGLDPDADLLLYGCDLAASAEGQALLDDLAALTGADVAASDDPTGNAGLGGDWDLEHQIGEIESEIAIGLETQQTWIGLLASEPTGTAIWTEAGATIPQYADWDGAAFGTESKAADTGQYVTITGAEAPTRDEKIVIGMEADGTISGQIWDGSVWAPLPTDIALDSSGTLATGVDITNFSQSFAVTYESQSGDALLVWNRGVKKDFGYATWDGTSWTVSAVGFQGGALNAETIEMRLAASPNSDEIIFVGSTAKGEDYAIAWDGTAWSGTAFVFESNTGDGNTDISVAYEQQSGTAVLVYSDGSTDLFTEIWDGANWNAGPQLTKPAGIQGNVQWTALASDPNSDRIALSVSTASNEGWVSVWDGSAWETSVTVAGPGAATSSLAGVLDVANIDVSFEPESGEALVVYGSNADSTLRYQTWKSGSGWSGESLGPALPNLSNTIQLEAAPYGDTIMLLVQDDGHQLHHLQWDGSTSSWSGLKSPLETATGTNTDQPFLYLWNINNEPPNGQDDAYELFLGQTLVVDALNGVLSNDSDPDSPTLSVESYSSPSAGTLSLNADGSFSYTPDPGPSWTFDSFQYFVTDGLHVSGPINVTFSLSADVLPETNDVSGSGLEDAGPIAITLSGTDLDGTVEYFRLNGLPANGILYTDASMSLAAVAGTDYAAASEALTLYFMPDPDWSGTTVFGYVAIDDQSGADQTPATATITVTAVNDPPAVSLSNVTTSLAEGSYPSAVKVADIVVTDDALGTNTLSLSGTDAALFEIVGTELFLKAGSTVDYETNVTGSLDVRVEVDDAGIAGTPDGFADLSIAVSDVNEPPAVSLSNVTTSLAEGSYPSAVKVADIVVTDDALGTNTLSLSGTDAALFEIVGTELFLKAGTVLDRESNASLDVTVEVDDTGLGSGPEDSASLLVTVLNVNEPPGGSVTVTSTGAIQEDETLTADPSGITDPDGLTTATFTYQWQRFEAGMWVDVVGETGQSYTLTDADVGFTIRVAVAYTDDQGGVEAVYSAATVAVAGVNDLPTGNVVIDGTPTEDQTLTANATAIADDDGLGTFNYQWQRDDGTGWANVGGNLDSYTLGDADVGAQIRVIVSYLDGQGTLESLAPSAAVGPVANVNDPPTAILLSSATVAENTLGAIVGQLSVSDLDDPGDVTGQHSFTVSDARFEVDASGQLKLVDGVGLDYEFEPMVSLDVTATDGGGAWVTESFTLTVTDITELPTADIIPATYAADEQVALTLDGTGMQVSAPDAGTNAVTVTLSVGEGVINASAGSTSVTVNNSGTGLVTLLGTVDQINALLDGAGSVEYFNGLDAPSATATLTLAVDDGVNSGTVSDTATISIAPATDLPSVTLPGSSYSASEQTPLALHGTGISVAAPDAGGSDITVTLTVAEGEINVDPGPTGVGIVGSGTDTVTLSGSVSEINALLASDGSSGTIEYYNASDVPSASTTLTVTVADGINAAVAEATTIDIAAVNDAPTAVDDPFYVVDEDGSLSVPAASGVLANDSDPEGDSLSAIKVSDPANGTLVLNADGSFTYTPDPDFNGSDSFAYKVNDGTVDGSTARAYIAVTPINDPPSLNLSTTSVSYIEDAAAPTVLDAGLTISDPDDTQLSAAQITITDFVAGDALGFDTSGTSISGSYDGATGVLTLSGSDSIANYEQVLRTVAYSSTSDDPTLADTQTSRSLLWEIIDADADGSGWQGTDSASSSIVVGGVNDAPTATILQSSYNVVEDTPIMLSGTGMSVADVDAGPNIVQASLSAGAGSVFTVDPGTTGVTVSGSGTSSVTLDGTITAINDLLAGNMSASIYYEAPQNPVSGSLITLAIVDQGNTGTGGSMAGSDAASLNITASNDPPVVNVLIPSVTAQEDTDQAVTGISISDPDADTGDLLVTLSVSNGTLSAVAPASVSVVGAGTASMTLTGPLTDLNAALATLVYRGDADYVGADTLSIDVNDQGNTGPDGAKTDSGSVAITVASQNDLPQAVDDAYSVDEDGNLSDDVSVNDTGLGDGGIVYAVVPGAEPANGALVLNSDGSFTYTPNPDFNGSDSFAYSVTDVDGDSATATVTLTVNPIDDPAAPIDDTNTASEGGSSVGGNVLLNDSAPDTPATVTAADESGTPITIGSPYLTAAGGQIVINSDGSYNYTPPSQGGVPAAGLVEVFSYTITDADGDSAAASLTINVVNSDAATPSASADSFTVDEGATFDTTTGDLLTSGSASVLGNDGGLIDTPITVSLISGVSHGTLSLNSDGRFVYSHDGSENFSDSFTYRVTDDDGQTSDAIVDITINAINDTPTTTGIANVTVDEDASPTVIDLALAFSDAEDPASALTYSVVGNTNPSLFSSVAIDQGLDELTLTYAADTNGVADLTVRATDSGGEFVDASFTVTVNPVDDLPVAVDDAVSVNEDGIVSASVAGNDTGLGDGPVVYALVGGSGPANGLLTFNPDGSFIYAPDLNYSGSDGFSYTVTDADGDSATATVTLTINPLNDLPNPVDDSNVASEGGAAATGNVLANDSSPDAPTTVTAADESGTAITIGSPYTTAAGGELTLNSDGSYSYTPPSQGQVPVAGLTESFTYTITDSSGDTATAVLSITVDNSDLSLPQAVADEFTLIEGGTFDTGSGDLLASGSASLLGNDTGLTDTPISVSLVSDVSHGSLVLNADGSFVYTHDGSENLADAFTYRITDDDGQTSDASVSINVTPVNDNAPVVTSAATTAVAEGDTAVLQVVASDADLPGDALSFGIAATGADGALFQIDGSGNLSFVSAPDYEAPADANGDNVYEVGVEVFDGVHTTIQDISVTVTAVNDNAPVITSAATASVAEGDPAVLQVTASDADLPGDSLSYAIVGTGADDALFQIDGSGNLSFIAPPDYEAPADANGDNVYEVDVEVFDGVNTATQSITVDVTAVNDYAPVITSASVVDVTENTSAVLTVTAVDGDLPGDSLGFAVAGTGADDALFQIDGAGNLSFVSAPDYEAPADANGDNVYEVDVEVSDGVYTSTQSVTVTVTPINDNAPVITSTLNVSVAENTTAVTQVIATDDDLPADSLSIAIAGTGADDGLFQIDGSGNLSFIAAPDFENPADADANNLYEVAVSVTDGVNTSVETIGVTVTDGNELPASPDRVFSISEGASNGSLVGQVTATDPEGGNLSFAIVAGDPSGALAINASNGRITVADATLLDYETNPQMVLTVEVTDDGVPALSVYPQVTINVTDVNEAPVNIRLWDPVTGTFDSSVEEHTDSSGGAVFRDLVTGDPDAGDTHSYAIVGGADAGKFSLSGNRLTLDDGLLDYESQSSYEVTIRSTDAGGLFIEQTLTMVVNDLNDAPVITSTAIASILENDTVATTLTATDEDGDTLSYFISGGADQALFAVDPVTGELSFIAAPDYENPLDADLNSLYEVQVSVGDGAASASQSITVSVADGADAPSGVLLSNSTVTGQTDTTGGFTVGTLSAIDQDAGDTASFGIVGGADAASFGLGGISGNELVLDDGVLDAGVQSSYQVTVRATDSTGRTFDQSLVVTVDPYVPPVAQEPDPEPAPPPAPEPEPEPQPEPTSTEPSSGETAAETATETLNEEPTVEGGGMHSLPEDSGSTSDSLSAPDVDLGGTDVGAATADTQVALADASIFAPTALDSGTALQGSASGFVGGTIAAPDGAPGTEATVVVDPVIRQLVEPGEFVQELDEVRESVTDQQIVVEKTVVGSTMVASTGLSVGYVLWLVRGGVLISSLLSSLPAWRLIDPLPVLSYANNDDEDEESLESMVKSHAGDADKDPEELPEQDPPYRPAPQPSGAA